MVEKDKKEKGIAFSGGLSMNIKANGDIMNSPMVNWLSIPQLQEDVSLYALVPAIIMQSEIKLKLKL